MTRTGVEARRADGREAAALRRLDGLAYVLDNSIPIPGIGPRPGRVPSSRAWV